MNPWLLGLLNFLFPAHCLVCGKLLASHREVLCLGCEYRMPFTEYRDDPENPVSKIFWGRVPVECATSLFRFEKGSAYQGLLHELKYRGNHFVGFFLGRHLGGILAGTSFAACQVIVPVPLHRSKKRKRGYNQSEVIARGVSEVTGIPVVPDLLVRTAKSGSQTSRGRYERFENVLHQFRIHEKFRNRIPGKLLLIDDVITTGATLEACCTAILAQASCRIYIATAACA